MGENVSSIKKDFAALHDMVIDPETDLYRTIPWGSGETFLREIMTVANHNAFHLGEFAMMRQATGTWG